MIERASAYPGLQAPVEREARRGTQTKAVDTTTGDRLWTFETGVSTGAPIVTGDRVLATGANTGIHVLDAATGDRLGHWPAGNVGSQPVLARGRLIYRGWDVYDVFVLGTDEERGIHYSGGRSPRIPEHVP